jgi:Rod binding domain-containing protein
MINGFTPSSPYGLLSATSLREDELRDADRVSTSQRVFSQVLARADDRALTPQQQARSAAEQFVSIAMVQPLLSQLRQTNQAAPPFAPSNAEKQFQSLFDAQVAERITSAKKFPLVDAVAEQLLKRLESEQPLRRSSEPASRLPRVSA